MRNHGLGRPHHLNLAAEQIGQCLPGSFVRHVQQLDPRQAFNDSADRCEAAPPPVEPYESLAGFALAYAMNSVTDFADTSGLITTQYGGAANNAMGSNSGKFSAMIGLLTNGISNHRHAK